MDTGRLAIPTWGVGRPPTLKRSAIRSPTSGHRTIALSLLKAYGQTFTAPRRTGHVARETESSPSFRYSRRASAHRGLAGRRAAHTREEAGAPQPRRSLGSGRQ